MAETYELIKPELQRVEECFSRQVTSDIPAMTTIGRYLQTSGGKRVRPALLILVARALGAQTEESIVRMATVMEFLHTATLVHDDIIDDSDLRRGNPSVRAQWGNDIAVLAGDWLYMSAFEETLKERNFEILDLLTRVTRLMTEGELMQLSQRRKIELTEGEYLDIVCRKTGFLISACCEIGAILASASQQKQKLMKEFGLKIGIAFQLADDLLDFTSTDEKLGKPAANDLCEGTLTLPLIYFCQQADEAVLKKICTVMNEGGFFSVDRQELLGYVESSGSLERARIELTRYAIEAQQLLSSFPDTVYKRALSSIASFIIAREN
ncbi:MAG: polyprenyl synthetase family protein [Blastocatellia bacterium]|nr:polyprenyl synthetase family protein [Blastocatellia bacterium]